ncbi:ArsR/SmtB family transcription factor [Thermoactinomyces mirandus]|nr:metalloregulator ArsR/SmtB family transcription factor [Thermoactinomyces mirandus]
MPDFEQLTECYKALGDQTRLQILSFLKEGERCVCELVQILNITQPAVSRHMRKLKNAKLVKERRSGQWVFYSLDGSIYPFFEKIVDSLPDSSEEIEKLNICDSGISCNS